MVPRLVVRPFLVHRVVDPRQDAHHLALADVETDVGADRVHRRRCRRFSSAPTAAPGSCRAWRAKAPTGRRSTRLPESSLSGGSLVIARHLAVLAAVEHSPFAGVNRRPRRQSRYSACAGCSGSCAVLTIGPIYLSFDRRACSRRSARSRGHRPSPDPAGRIRRPGRRSGSQAGG